MMWYEKYMVPTSYDKMRITKEMKKEKRRRVERARLVGVKMYWNKKKLGGFQKDDDDDDTTAVKAAVMSSPDTEQLLVRMSKDLKKHQVSSSSSSSSPEKVVFTQEQKKEEEEIGQSEEEKEEKRAQLRFIMAEILRVSKLKIPILGGVAEDDFQWRKQDKMLRELWWQKEKLEKELGEDEGVTVATAANPGLSKEEVDIEWVTDKPPPPPPPPPPSPPSQYWEIETIDEDEDVEDNFEWEN